MKTSYIMCASKSMAPKLSWPGIKNLVSEFRKPTSAPMKTLRYVVIAVTGGLLFYKVAVPAYKEYRFHRFEALANDIYALEVKQKESE